MIGNGFVQVSEKRWLSCFSNQAEAFSSHKMEL